eukprot:TRINITY_DN64_c6_g1_i1.p1 TRINITY_DN64_c6_g1~~TRINITY_DN64_c6_g1_i1.p1  ORF type:complete len:349 (+),score=135.40 TRINITY_DN64_c6_g1_i1:143-1048(+)
MNPLTSWYSSSHQSPIVWKYFRHQLEQLCRTIMSVIMKQKDNNNNSDLLELLSPLLVSFFQSTNKKIKSSTIEFWNSTFGKSTTMNSKSSSSSSSSSSSLNCPTTLKSVLKELRSNPNISINIPSSWIQSIEEKSVENKKNNNSNNNELKKQVVDQPVLSKKRKREDSFTKESEEDSLKQQQNTSTSSPVPSVDLAASPILHEDNEESEQQQQQPPPRKKNKLSHNSSGSDLHNTLQKKSSTTTLKSEKAVNEWMIQLYNGESKIDWNDVSLQQLINTQIQLNNIQTKLFTFIKNKSDITS